MTRGEAPQSALDALALEMLGECVRTGQAARTLPDETDSDAVRSELRRLARGRRVRIRTARMGVVVVVVRTDAALWDEDTATMRRKLTPR